MTIGKEKTFKDAIQLMKERDISQIPVTQNGSIVGSVTEHQVLSSLLKDPAASATAVADHMAHPFPFVDLKASTKEISSLINKENTAVLVKDKSGSTHIITEWDLIQAIAG